MKIYDNKTDIRSDREKSEVKGWIMKLHLLLKFHEVAILGFNSDGYLVYIILNYNYNGIYSKISCFDGYDINHRFLDSPKLSNQPNIIILSFPNIY